MSELRKCPFCGREAEVVKAHSNTTEFPYVVVCKNDLCNASVGRFSTSRENAIKAWNTRKPMEAVVAELENFEMWKELLIYDLSHREREIIEKAISIVRGKE